MSVRVEETRHWGKTMQRLVVSQVNSIWKKRDGRLVPLSRGMVRIELSVCALRSCCTLHHLKACPCPHGPCGRDAPSGTHINESYVGL